MKNPLQNFYKNNFVYSTKEKLSKLTSLAISILNLIVFLVLMEGLDFQTNFVSHPNNIYSSKTMYLFLSKIAKYCDNLSYNCVAAPS